MSDQNNQRNDEQNGNDRDEEGSKVIKSNLIKRILVKVMVLIIQDKMQNLKFTKF